MREFDDRKLDGIATRAAGGEFAVEEVSVEVLGYCGQCRGKPRRAVSR